MAAITRDDLNAGVMQTYLKRKTLDNLEPQLYFYQFGEKPLWERGYQTIAWARFDQIAGSSVTKGTSANDGVTPADTAFNATVISVTPFQLRIVITLADMVIDGNVINFVNGAAEEIAYAMGRRIDYEIQSVLVLGTNYIYAGVATTRAALASGDELDMDTVDAGVTYLDSVSAPRFPDGYFRTVIHSFVARDLRRDVGTTGNWLEINKYTSPEKMYNGEIGALSGARFVQSPFVQQVAANKFPTYLIARGAYGVPTFQSLKAYITDMKSSDSDPLAQRTKVGAKMAFNSIILQEARLLRIESWTDGVVLDVT